MMDISDIKDEDINNMTMGELQELETQLGLEEKETDGAPQPEKKDSNLILFREIIKANDTTKLGFLRKEELGLLPNSVRKYKKMALFADSQNMIDVAQYLEDHAEIILATSLSHKGKLIDTIVTQIKRDIKTQTQPTTVKTGMFGSKVTTSDDGGQAP